MASVLDPDTMLRIRAALAARLRILADEIDSGGVVVELSYSTVPEQAPTNDYLGLGYEPTEPVSQASVVTETSRVDWSSSVPLSFPVKAPPAPPRRLFEATEPLAYGDYTDPIVRSKGRRR